MESMNLTELGNVCELTNGTQQLIDPDGVGASGYKQ